MIQNCNIHQLVESKKRIFHQSIGKICIFFLLIAEKIDNFFSQSQEKTEKLVVEKKKKKIMSW